jgi:cation diffusion facilitator CzcD-associated flavoprotein CzcO
LTTALCPFFEWSKFYASGDEILKYIQNVTDRFGLAENVHLNSRVVSTTWSDTKGRWSIKVEQRVGKLIEDEAAG